MAFLFASSSLLPAFRSLVWALAGVGASSMLLPAFRYLVPPPAAYFPAKESRQSSPGLRARTRGRGAAVEVRGLQAL